MSEADKRLVERARVTGMIVDRTGARPLLPAYTSLGSYPFIYQDARGDMLCAKCATKEIRKLHPGTMPARQGVFWEGEPAECEVCQRTILPAYQ